MVRQESDAPTVTVRTLAHYGRPKPSWDLRKIDVLAVDEVAQLWTSYHAKQHLLANDVGRRLTNFFWRLWSDDALRKSLSGSQVALLFECISEGSIIRTTPKSSPRHSRIIPASQSSIESVAETVEGVRSISRESSDGLPQPVPSFETLPPLLPNQSPGSTFRDGTRDRGSVSATRPAPILKKPGSESSASGKTARIQPPAFKTGKNDPDHDEPMSPEEARELSRQLSQESAPSIDEAMTIDDDASDQAAIDLGRGLPTAGRGLKQAPKESSAAQPAAPTSSSGQGRASKKKAFVVSRKRPLLTRKQSSQSSQSHTSSNSKASPGLKSSSSFQYFTSSPESTGEYMQPGRSRNEESATMHRLTVSRSASPISQSAFRRVSRDHQTRDADINPVEVHNRALSEVSLGNEFVPLHESLLRPVDMRRQSSSASFVGGNLTPKSSAAQASSSSSDVQAAGHISVDAPSSTVTNLSTPSPALGIFSRASSLFTGKGRSKLAGQAAFDVGPDDTDPTNDDASRRASLEFGSTPVSPKTTAGFGPLLRASSSSALPPSRSRSQLSNLLEQDSRRDSERAERERTRTAAAKGKSPKR